MLVSEGKGGHLHLCHQWEIQNGMCRSTRYVPKYLTHRSIMQCARFGIHNITYCVDIVIIDYCKQVLAIVLF